MPARLQLFSLAYNLANFLRRLAPQRSVKHGLLTTLRNKLIKIGAMIWTQRIASRPSCMLVDGEENSAGVPSKTDARWPPPAAKPRTS